MQVSHWNAWESVGNGCHRSDFSTPKVQARAASVYELACTPFRCISRISTGDIIFGGPSVSGRGNA